MKLWSVLLDLALANRELSADEWRTAAAKGISKSLYYWFSLDQSDKFY